MYASDTGSTGAVLKVNDHLQIAANNSTGAGTATYFKDDGTVGIGTVYPGAKLSIVGDVSATGGLSAVGVCGEASYFGGCVGIGTTAPTQNLDVAGDAAFAQYIYHRGDEDTNIKFIDDDMMFNVGGSTFLRFTENASQDMVTVNGDAEDIDFKVTGQWAS